MKVTKQFRTETAHRLPNHGGLCRYIHGHSYLWEVTVEGEPDENNMVIDFKSLKLAMENTIGLYDHALILSAEDPLANLLRHATERLRIVSGEPTAELFAKNAGEKLRGGGLNVVRVRVWETVTSYADWNWEG